MNTYILRFLVLIILTGCTTQLVEININRNGEVETISTSSTPKEIKDIVNTETETKSIPITVPDIPEVIVPETKIEIKPISPKVITQTIKSVPSGWCPKFVMPELIPIPPIPKDILDAKDMAESKLVGILTEYASELRKTASINKITLNNAYKKHTDLCKK